MLSIRFILLSLFAAFLFTGCASGTFKARQEQRERLAASSGMYCEFISGDLFPDVDVELSMSMARRCDSNKTFSVTSYKNSSDHSGVIYCCATKGTRGSGATKRSSSPPARSEAPASSSSDDVIAE